MSENWVKKHPILTGILGLIILGIIFNIFLPEKADNLDISYTVDEIKDQSKVVSYDKLINNPGAYQEEIIYFHGKVIQVSTDENGNYILRIATSGSYDDIILATYNQYGLTEGAIVDLWGTFLGPISYESVLGSEVTIPGLKILHLELLSGDNSGMLFSRSLAKNTQNGITLSIDGYKFEKRGDNWGQLTEISFTLENRGSSTIYPDLVVELYDKNTDMKNVPSKKVELDIILNEGDSASKSVSFELGASSIETNKTIRLFLVDYSNVYVVTSLENVSFVQDPVKP